MNNVGNSSLAEDGYLELFRAQRETIQKQTYFLLTAAGAAIAFAVTQTKDLALAWSQLPLGWAVLCWATSFYLGCHYLVQTGSILRMNLELLRVQAGRSEWVSADPQLIAGALRLFGRI